MTTFVASNNNYVNYPIRCQNCFKPNHMYRNCNAPVISIGIICYKMHYDENSNSIFPKFLMVQRKDSLSYVEFIRGKFELNNKHYILKLFSNMIETERNKIRNNDFDFLWKQMWLKNDNERNRNFTKEFDHAKLKFDQLKTGYYMVSDDKKYFFDINYVLDNTIPEYDDTEWGFPKGRREINESDIHCALREFREETGIHPNLISINYITKPLEEIFSGSNNVRYKHVYYVAKLHTNVNIHRLFDPANKLQCKEIKNCEFFSYKESQDHIRNSNVERKELLKRLNSIILKNIH